MNSDETEAMREDEAIRFALGEMAPEEAKAFAEALGSDPDLAELVAVTRDSLAVLAGDLPSLTPPPELRDQVLAAVSPRIVLPTVTGRNRRGMRVWPALAAAAVMTLAAIVGWSLWIKSTREMGRWMEKVAAITKERDTLAANITTLENNLAEARSENDLAEIRIASLRSELEQAYVATLAWSQNRQEGVLDLSQLPPNEEGKSYQLWIVDENNAEPISAGAFELSANGTVRIPFTPVTAVANPIAFAISVERAGGVPKREGPIIVSQGL